MESRDFLLQRAHPDIVFRNTIASPTNKFYCEFRFLHPRLRSHIHDIPQLASISSRLFPQARSTWTKRSYFWAHPCYFQLFDRLCIKKGLVFQILDRKTAVFLGKLLLRRHPRGLRRKSLERVRIRRVGSGTSQTTLSVLYAARVSPFLEIGTLVCEFSENKVTH